jgi:hypothetical protein
MMMSLQDNRPIRVQIGLISTDISLEIMDEIGYNMDN